MHRVQRVPQTETQGRIHTSTATVAVLPQPKEVAPYISDRFHDRRQVDVDVRDRDIKLDTFRASQLLFSAVAVCSLLRQPGRAGSTSTPRTARCGSRTSPPALWSSARASVRSTRPAPPRHCAATHNGRTAPWRSRCSKPASLRTSASGSTRSGARCVAAWHDNTAQRLPPMHCRSARIPARARSASGHTTSRRTASPVRATLRLPSSTTTQIIA